MKHLWKILPIVSFCFVASANQHTVGFLDTLNTAPLIEDYRANNADTCTDFTGTWKGTCMGAGEKKDQDFSLKQVGCTAIEVSAGTHKKALPIGGVFAMSGVIPGTPGVTFGGHIDSHWNADKTKLHIVAMGGGKKIDLTSAPKGGMYSNTMYMKDGKLYTDIFMMGHGPKLSFCEFTKQ